MSQCLWLLLIVNTVIVNKNVSYDNTVVINKHNKIRKIYLEEENLKSSMKTHVRYSAVYNRETPRTASRPKPNTCSCRLWDSHKLVPQHIKAALTELVPQEVFKSQ